MKRLCIAFALLFVANQFHGETILLNSGEKVQGEIVSDTNGIVQVRIANAARTIFFVRPINHTDIKEIQKETADQALKRKDDEAFQETQRYQLKTASFSIAYYDQVVTNVFQQFLNSYRSSSHSNAVADSVAQWTEERDKVASGAVKWNGQWYTGNEANKVAGLVRASQLVDEGDRQLGYGRYEAAINKYSEAIVIRPLPIDYIQTISTKASIAGQKWKDTVSATPPPPPASPTNYREENRDLRARRAEIQRTLDADISKQNDILSATAQCVHYSNRGVCTIKHWFTPHGVDLGQVLPDSHSYDVNIRNDRQAIAKIDEQIAANRANASQPTQVLNTPPPTQKIDSLLGQFQNQLMQAKADTQSLVPETHPIKSEAPVLVASAPVQPQTVSTEQTTPAVPTQVSVAKNVSIEPPEPWLDRNWKWVGGLFALLLVAYIVCR